MFVVRSFRVLLHR